MTINNSCRFITLFLSVLFFFNNSCKTSSDPLPKVEHYLHIAHTRTNSNPDMDSIAEIIDYSKYDMLWLGGDLAKHTSINDEAMIHVDSIFDLGNSNTLWALGNHDYNDLAKIAAYSKRPNYYSYHRNRITYVVLDTQDSLSSFVGAQKALLENIADTIQESSHLVLLHHKLIWMYGNTELESQIGAISNGSFGGCFFCINPNNFNTEIYPNLVKIKNKGIEILCIGGDIGHKAKEFEYLTPEGIHFLASGISAGSSKNKALLFTHDLTTGVLNWEFKLLTEL